jgi:hypothetical protein
MSCLNAQDGPAGCLLIGQLNSALLSCGVITEPSTWRVDQVCVQRIAGHANCTDSAANAVLTVSTLLDGARATMADHA